MPEPDRENVSPWRAVFEAVRDAVGDHRDEDGAVGSINWLRRRMEARGGNPNVVRNILYRDKGRLADKRILYGILRDLWRTSKHEPLVAPELDLLLSPQAGAEQEVLQLLSREKRRVLRGFVRNVRDGKAPKLLLTGRPGSGKTMLLDFVQHSLACPPAAPVQVVRADLGAGDLLADLTDLAERTGVPRDAVAERSARIAAGGPFAVQADAQADFARAMVQSVAKAPGVVVLLLHLSAALASRSQLGPAALRLHTPEVPRVAAHDWLWHALLQPWTRLTNAALLVTTAELPPRARHRSGAAPTEVRLAPPSPAEARRFVKARLPHVGAAEQEGIVQRAGRSFEDLRTLTLLAEIRSPLPDDGAKAEERTERLAALALGPSDQRLASFLCALATLALPEFPTFERHELSALRPAEHGDATPLEAAFLDAVPGGNGAVRCFSRQLLRTLRERLEAEAPERYRASHLRAAERLRQQAEREPDGTAATRRLHHLLEARALGPLIEWADRHDLPSGLLRRAWRSAQEGSEPECELRERLAQRVAAHYLKLGATDHPDAVAALAVLRGSDRPDRRARAAVQRAEAARQHGRWDEAAVALRDAEPLPQAPDLRLEAALLHAALDRRGHAADALGRFEERVRPALAAMDPADPATARAAARVALQEAHLRCDVGDEQGACEVLRRVATEDVLLRARAAHLTARALYASGRATAAREHADVAVRLAHRSGALPRERIRYLLARAALLREADDLQGAEADVEAARAIADEPGQDVRPGPACLLRIEVETGWLRLAAGRHDDALGAWSRPVTATTAADALAPAFEQERVRLRMATAYAARALASPWSASLPCPAPAGVSGPDGERALRLLAAWPQAHAGERPERTDLRREAMMLASILVPVAEAGRYLERAKAAVRHPFGDARVALATAAVRIRQGSWREAEAALRAGSGRDGEDPRIDRLRSAVELRLRVALDDANAATTVLARALRSDLPDRAKLALVRAFGEALEQHGRESWLQTAPLPDRLAGADPLGVRPADLLAGRFLAATPGSEAETLAPAT